MTKLIENVETARWRARAACCSRRSGLCGVDGEVGGRLVRGDDVALRVHGLNQHPGAGRLGAAHVQCRGEGPSGSTTVVGKVAPESVESLRR